MPLALVFVAVFLGVGLATYGLLTLLISDDRRVSRRLTDMTSYEIAQSKEAQPMLKSFGERVVKPSAKSFSNFSKGVLPTTYHERLVERVEQAGYPNGVDADRLVLAQIMIVVVLVGIALAGGVISGWAIGKTLLLALMGGLVGAIVPDLWLRSKVSSRKHQIVRDLPDILDMLTISVEAGMGFDAALAKLVKNTKGPLSEEFARALQEIQAGATRREALRATADRADVPELTSFVASIVQADMFGVSIAQVLRAQSGEIRLRRRQRAEEQAQRAPVKMVFPLIVCILPCTMIVILGPAAIRIATVLLGY